MKRQQIEVYIQKGLITERVHPEYPHIRIYNYTNKCQIEQEWDDVTLQCRGLILNVDSGEVVARPFNKFFNLEERDHQVPDETPHILEKYDGSLGILYWVEDVPYVATRGSFESEQAVWATKYLRENVNFEKFSRDYTYLFEIVYPQNRIVVNYDWSGLVLIGVRHIQSGKHAEPSLSCEGVRQPETHKVTTLEELKGIERDNAEGFVVWYPSTDLFIKLKHDEYKRLHKLVTGVNAKVIWELLRYNKGIEELLENVPDEFYKWVKETAESLKWKYTDIEGEALQAHGAVKDLPSRKEQAIALKDERYKGVVFAMLDSKPYEDIIWKQIKPKADEPFKQEI